MGHNQHRASGNHTTIKTTARDLIVERIESITDREIERRVGKEKAAAVRAELCRIVRVFEVMG